MIPLRYFYSMVLAMLAGFTKIFRGLRGAKQNHSSFADDANSAIDSLESADQRGRDAKFLQFANEMLTKMIKELEAGDVYYGDWTKVTGSLGLVRGLLHTFHTNLDHSQHVSLPEQFPSLLIETFRNIRDLDSTLHECRHPSVLDRVILGYALIRRTSKCSAEIEDLLDRLKSFVRPKLIYSNTLDDVLGKGIPLDINPMATPQRYRFVECAPLIDEGILCIWEFLHIPSEPYSAVSYVWRGNDVPDGFDVPAFTVRGAEDADPISTELLQHACAAALKRGTPFLWLDRLSIMQTNREDKNWQISKMYNMYCFCAFCVIIPAGLRRLVSLREETQWIHRGWTLQEALAPPIVEVLFSWTLGELQAIPGDSNGFRGNITEVVKGGSAMAPLWLILDACVAGSVSLFEVDAAFSSGRFEQISIFGVGVKGYTGSDFRFALPNVAALAAAVSRSMREDYDRKCYTIWKCALMRTSSRPVDMVFSIMGLFGVILDPSPFDKNDRVGATIALAREILKRGGRATWLGACFHVPPFSQVSTFPNFPRTAVAGKALVRVTGGYAEMSKLMDNEYPIAEVLGPMPRGAMDENGYLTFDAKAMELVKAPSDILESEQSEPKTRRIEATNGTTWYGYEHTTLTSEPSSKWQPKAFAVLLGCFFGYSPTMTPAYDCNNVRGLIVEEHEPDRFHVNSYFMLSIRTIDWVVSWTQHEFCVGGPDRITATYLDEPLLEVQTIDTSHIIAPDEKTTFGNIGSKHIYELAMAARPSLE